MASSPERRRRKLVAAVTSLAAALGPDAAGAAHRFVAPDNSTRPPAHTLTLDTVPHPLQRDGTILLENKKTSEDEQQLQSHFYRFAGILSANLTPDAYAKLAKKFNTLSDPSKLSERFFVNTVHGQTSTLTRYGLNLDNKNSEPEATTAEKLGRSDFIVSVVTDFDGNTEGLGIRANVAQDGSFIPRVPGREPLPSEKLEQIIHSTIKQPDDSNANQSVHNTRNARGLGIIAITTTDLVRTTYIFQDGSFGFSVRNLSGEQLPTSVLEPETPQIPQEIIDRQERVKRDFNANSINLSTYIIDLYANPNVDSKKITYSEGPGGSTLATYEIHVYSETDPETNETGAYMMRATVGVNPDLTPKPKETYGIKIKASNANESYTLGLVQNPLQDTPNERVTITSTHNDPSVDTHSRIFIVDPSSFSLTPFGELILPENQNIGLLDRRGSTGIANLISLIINDAAERKQIDTGLAYYFSIDPSWLAPTIMSFEATAREGDNTWTLLLDHVQEKWKGQNKVVATIATAFLEKNGKNPKFILPGDLVNLSDLTEAQIEIVRKAASAESLEAYFTDVAQAFDAAINK